MVNSETMVMLFLGAAYGLPYKWGGNHMLEGFDCSGLDIEIAKIQGINIKGDKTAQELYRFYLDNDGVHVPRAFYGVRAFYGQSLDKIRHVAFCLNKSVMIEAGGGTQYMTPDDAKKVGACVRFRPISNRGDLVALISPKTPW